MWVTFIFLPVLSLWKSHLWALLFCIIYQLTTASSWLTSDHIFPSLCLSVDSAVKKGFLLKALWIPCLLSELLSLSTPIPSYVLPSCVLVINIPPRTQCTTVHFVYNCNFLGTFILFSLYPWPCCCQLKVKILSLHSRLSLESDMWLEALWPPDFWPQKQTWLAVSPWCIWYIYEPSLVYRLNTQWNRLDGFSRLPMASWLSSSSSLLQMLLISRTYWVLSTVVMTLSEHFISVSMLHLPLTGSCNWILFFVSSLCLRLWPWHLCHYLLPVKPWHYTTTAAFPPLQPVCVHGGPLSVCLPTNKQNNLQNCSFDLLTSLKCFDFSLTI